MCRQGMSGRGLEDERLSQKQPRRSSRTSNTGTVEPAGRAPNSRTCRKPLNATHLPKTTGKTKHRYQAKSTKRGSTDYVDKSFRFVVDPGLCPWELQSGQAIPPDAILRIVAPQAECPICLGAATVPRMLSCGHVLCFACLHRFLALTTNYLCPICAAQVRLPAKATSFIYVEKQCLPTVDSKITLTLMKRESGGQPLPVVHAEEPSDYLHFPPPDQILYSRVVSATAKYLLEELDRELKELIAAEKHDSKVYGANDGYKEAISDLRREKTELKERISTGWFEEREQLAARKRMLDGNSHKPSAPPYFYYQTALESLSPYVLSSLDVAILRAAHNEFSSMPPTLVVRVEGLGVSSTISDAHGGTRPRYISHLPPCTPVYLLECEWDGVVKKSVLKRFAGQLKDRRIRRELKASREEEERVRIQEFMDLQLRADVLLDGPQQPVKPPSLHALPKLPQAASVKPMFQNNWRKNIRDREFEEFISKAQVAEDGKELRIDL